MMTVRHCGPGPATHAVSRRIAAAAAAHPSSISAQADRSARIAETTAAALLSATRPHRDFASVSNRTTSGRTPAIYCDERIVSSNRPCRSRASWYDATSRHNQCGTHRSRIARAGTGPSWSSERTTFLDRPDVTVRACDTPGHAHKAARAIGADGVARCLFCSFDHELAKPIPVFV